MTGPKRHWSFSLRTLFVLVTAATCTWLSGQWLRVGWSFGWGLIVGCAMRLGMSLATPEAWDRKTGLVQKTLVMGWLLLLLFVPAIVGLARGGFSLGLAQTTAIWLGLALADAGYTWWFGPALAGAPVSRPEDSSTH